MMRWNVLVLAMLLLMTGLVYAVQPNEMLADPAMEARARDIGKELRCLVCQNQSIDDSDADLAHDLRVLLRQRLMAGDTDAQAKQYLVDRYGDYVLLKPPFKATTLALWLGPFVFLLAAIALAMPLYRRRNSQGEFPEPLSAEEKKRLAALDVLDGRKEKS
jgi:cytochrome c-type biogenesis protein CcmH